MEFIYSIAGLTLKVDTGQLILPADALTNETCRQFFLSGLDINCNRDDQIDVLLTPDSAPDMTGCQQVFDSRDSWSIYRRRESFYVVDQYPPFSKPVWTARFQSDGDRVIVYCGNDIIDTRSGTLTFNPIAYPLDQILLMNCLAARRGGIIHAAGWALNGSGWVFAGKSGSGKTTLAGLISDLHAGSVLSDDRIVIRESAGTFEMYGSPWPGEGGYAENRGVELERLIFLTRGLENRIAEIPFPDAVSRLLPVLSVPWYDKDKVAAMMDFCDGLITRIPTYELSFRPDASAAGFLKAVAYDCHQA